MKKVISALLASMMALTFSACGSSTAASQTMTVMFGSVGHYTGKAAKGLCKRKTSELER